MSRKGHDINRDLMMEFIGTRLSVVRHTDPGLSGKEGRVLNETMNTFLLEEEGKRIVVPKKGGEFLISGTGSDDKPLSINGEDIIFRPEDRNKRMERKRSKRR